jgi:hypothetical protein
MWPKKIIKVSILLYINETSNLPTTAHWGSPPKLGRRSTLPRSGLNQIGKILLRVFMLNQKEEKK